MFSKVSYLLISHLSFPIFFNIHRINKFVKSLHFFVALFLLSWYTLSDRFYITGVK